VTSLASPRRVGGTWSDRTVRIVRQARLAVILLLVAVLLSLAGFWIAGGGLSSNASPAPAVTGKVSAIYPVQHYSCFATAEGRKCGQLFSQVPLHVGETVRISQITIAGPDNGAPAPAFVVVRPLGK
jgi:hypothetical protein